MLGIKTAEEKVMLADYERAGQDMRDLQDCIDKLINTVELQAQAIETRDQLLEDAYHKIAEQEIEINIRRNNERIRHYDVEIK